MHSLTKGLLVTRKLTVLFLLTLWLIGCGGTDPAQPIGTGIPDLISIGRQRLLQNAGVGAVQAIDGLTVEQAEFIYQNIALWDDSRVALTGTVAEGCQGVGVIAASEFGPDAVYRLMLPLGDSGHSTVVSFARNLNPIVEMGRDRCRDSLTAEHAPQSFTNRNPEVISLLTPDLATMPKFHALRQLLPGTLPEEQRQVLKTLRDNLTYPANGQQIQKVIKVGDMQNYLNGTFDPKVFGFQAVYSDVDNLVTAAELIEGLRLDYPGGFQGLTVVAALVYFQDDTFRMIPPYRAANGGNRTDPYPFTGNGFTATVRANAIPEWILPNAGVNLQDGSQLFLVDDQGNRTLQATFLGGGWVLANNQRSESALPRARVERVARYDGHEVYVISRDEEHYHVNASEDLGLIDQVQVGRGEYRGQVAKDDLRLVFQP